MAALALAFGWVMAGRVLRPLRAMKAATQRITELSLHERLALPGPADEVKDLADTIDGLLARLETAFEAQRRFVASASHELRTPLALDRALLEVALADPGATAAELRSTCEELLASGEQQERLLEGLLTLASSERGLDRRERFDLAAVTARAVAVHRAAVDCRALQVGVSLGSAVVAGDPDLAERMAANLVDNRPRTVAAAPARRPMTPNGPGGKPVPPSRCHIADLASPPGALAPVTYSRVPSVT